MSIAVMANVWEYSKAESSDLLVLLAIADYANGEGQAWPSIETLAARARMQRRGVQYCLKRLVELGELEVIPNAGPNGCNLYGVHVVHGCTPCTVHRGAHEPSLCTQTTKEIESKPKTSIRARDEEAFADTWLLYPKRAGGNSKADAFKAWTARIKQGYTPEEMLQGTERYYQFCVATDLIKTQFVKTAATFYGPGLHFKEDWTPPVAPKKTKNKKADDAWDRVVNHIEPDGEIINGDSFRVD